MATKENVGQQFQPFDMGPYNAAFQVHGQRGMSTDPNWDMLLHDPKMLRTAAPHAERIAKAYEDAGHLGLRDTGVGYYGNEHSLVEDVGRAFNENRERKGFEPYRPDDPDRHVLAGLMLRAGFSQNTNEKLRNSLVDKTASTGVVANHLSTKATNEALRTNAHPMDMYSNKLRDYTGSIYQPNHWNGTWNGEQHGLGYTIDRHQWDLAMGEKWGSQPRPLTSSPGNTRRYRVVQGFHGIAQDMVDPHHTLSPAQFQAVTWGPQRGSYE